MIQEINGIQTIKEENEARQWTNRGRGQQWQVGEESGLPSNR